VVERCRCVKLTTSRTSLRKCGILNTSQSYRPPEPVTGIALLTATLFVRFDENVGILNGRVLPETVVLLPLVLSFQGRGGDVIEDETSFVFTVRYVVTKT
jgi:hypothetical protein